MQTRALYTLGALAVVDWDQLEAMTTLTECLPRCYELGDMTLTADCEVDLASAYMIQGDTCAAALHAERALTTASETGDPWTEAWVLATTADCTVRQDLARDRGERALALSCSLGDRLLSAHIKANLGYGAVVAGDYDYARLISEQAISEGHGIWGASRKAQLEANLGFVALFKGEPSRAGRHLRRSLAHAQRIGWWAAAHEDLLGLAALAASEARNDQARSLAAAAQAVYNDPSENALHARLHDLLAGVTSDAEHQPALTAHQLAAILRDAAQDWTVDDTTSIP